MKKILKEIKYNIVFLILAILCLILIGCIMVCSFIDEEATKIIIKAFFKDEK